MQWPSSSKGLNCCDESPKRKCYYYDTICFQEINEEEVIQSVAVPPAVFQELLSFRELDSDLMRQSAFSMLDNEIDLKILTKSLVREKDLMEPDEPWEMNQLFAEIQSIATLSKDPETRPEENKEMLI